MKFKFLVGAFLLFSASNAQIALGQAPPAANMNSSTKPSATLEGLRPTEPLKQQMQKNTPSQSNLSSISIAKPLPLSSKQAFYLHPGILVNLNGQWEGSDHLLNVSSNIGVYVTIIKPEDLTLDFSSDQIKKEVENILTQVNINPNILVASDAPPLPLFEIEIFIYPIDKGFAASCQGRLFESVKLDRFKMDPNMAFQAITWEKQNLVISPKSLFQEQLTNIAKEITSSFAERYRIYEQLRNSPYAK